MGGWAGIAHGLTRTTLDVDIFIRPTTENARLLISALSEVGFGTARELTPQEILSRTAFLFADQIRVDIFTRPIQLQDFDACHARRWEAAFESIRIPFLCLEDLIKSKQTGREQDAADVEALNRILQRRKG